MGLVENYFLNDCTSETAVKCIQAWQTLLWSRCKLTSCAKSRTAMMAREATSLFPLVSSLMPWSQAFSDMLDVMPCFPWFAVVQDSVCLGLLAQASYAREAMQNGDHCNTRTWWLRDQYLTVRLFLELQPNIFRQWQCTWNDWVLSCCELLLFSHFIAGSHRWVAHPALVKVAKDIFDQHMTKPNQIEKLREDIRTTEADLLKVCS